MKPLLLFALLAVAFTGCEQKPTEEELAAAKAAEEQQQQRAKTSPTPKPGEWMWKDHKNPLDQKPERSSGR